MVSIKSTGACINCPHKRLILNEIECTNFETGSNYIYEIHCIHECVCEDKEEDKQ